MKIKTLNKILNVYKPVGLPSYDIVRKVKKVLNFKKVGHGGTLDPFAEGCLIILIGRSATKQMNDILRLPKTYQAILKLGVKTDTGDNEGNVVLKSDIPAFSYEKIREIEKKFIGKYLQTPPQYSAKKVNGKAAYKYARKGITVELKPKEVSIYNLDIEKISNDQLKICVTCSSGTYIRVLGEEIAERLNCHGHLTKLIRTSIGDYSLLNATHINELETALAQEIELLDNMRREEMCVD